MPILPKNNFSFAKNGEAPKEGQRHRVTLGGLTSGSGIPDEMLVMNHTDAQTLIENELWGRAKLFSTLTAILQEQGYTLDAAKHFVDVAQYYTVVEGGTHFPNVFGSQHWISLLPFTQVDLKDRTSNTLDPRETTTRFGFKFGAQSEPMKDGEGNYSKSYYVLDLEPFAVLKDAGVGQKMLQAYMDGFAKMAGMAEHDYLHHLVALTLQHSQYQFPRLISKQLPVPDGEVHTLALHAQICARLFAEEKPATDGKGKPVLLEDGSAKMIAVGARRKEVVLKWAATQFKQIADIQDAAMAHATDDAARAKITEAVTYLSEIYAHRLFRVISPHDADLRAKPLVLAQGESPTTVAAQCDRLTLRLPVQRGEATQRDGLSALQTLCAAAMGKLYGEIHRKQAIGINYYEGEKKSWSDLANPARRERYTLAGAVQAIAADGLTTMKERYRRVKDGGAGVAR